MSSAPDRHAAAFAQNASVLDIAVEDAATRAGTPFLPGPPPPRERPATLVGVAVLDRDLRYRRIDPGLAAISGRPAADHLGRTVAEALPDLAGQLLPLLRRVLATGEPVVGRPLAGRAPAAPAGRQWVASHFPLPPGPAALKDGRRGPAGVVSVVREVDAELARRPVGVSDERFRELVTRATVGLAQVDADGRFLYVNERFCGIVGWPRGQLVGARTQQSITHPRDAGANAAQFDAAVRSGEPYLIDKRYRRPDGKSVWVRNTVTLLPGPDGRVESAFAVVVDMTDRVRTERALRRSQDRLRLATEAGGLGVWSFDLEKGVPDWSPEALAIYGGGFDGRPSMDALRDRVHPDDWAAIAADTAASADPDGDARRIDLTHRVVHPPRTAANPGLVNETDEPVVRWVRSLGVMRCDADGRPSRSAGVLRDVTAERTAADRLAESERRLRQALAAADLGTWEYDAATGLSDWDERTAELFGVADDFRAGKRLFTHEEMLAAIHPADRGLILAEIPRTLDPAGTGRYEVEHRVVRPDGTELLLAVNGEAEFVGDGENRRAVRVTGTVKDATARRRAERRLAEREERLNLAADAAELGAYEIDLAAGEVWWDARVRALHGVPDAAETVPLADALAGVHPDDREAVAAELAAAHAPGGPERFRFEYRLRRPDGSVRWARTHGTVRFEPDEPGDDSGEGPPVPVRQVGYVQDVTAERERAAADAARNARLAEQARRLALAEERQRAAAQAAELGHYVLDVPAGELWWDARSREIFEFDGGETCRLAEGMGRIHPADRPGVAAQLAAMYDGSAPARDRFEYRIVLDGGAHRWVRSLSEAHFEDRPDGSREAVRLTGCLQDVTAEREREARLAEARDRQRLAAEAAGLGLFVIAPPHEGGLWWDARSREIFGFDGAEQVPFAEGLDRLHPDDRRAAEARLAEMYAGAAPPRLRFEQRVVLPDGAHRWVRTYSELEFETLPDGTRRPGRQVGFMQDVTAERERERRLAEARERRRIAADAAELGLFAIDIPTGTLRCDPRARELLDVGDRDTLPLGEAMARLHPDDHDAIAADMAAAFAGRAAPRVRFEQRLRRADGAYRWIRSYGELEFADRPDGTRSAARLTGYLQDIDAAKRNELALAEAKARLEHENDRLEAAVADRTEKLRLAAGRLGEVARQERDRIAHVLHDHLQQILVGAKMNLSVLGMTCAGEEKEVADRVAGLIDDAISESRNLSAELAPPILRTAGLAPALHWLAGQFEDRHGLSVEADCDAEASAKLDESLAALLFGAARECLLNAVKHAAAETVRVRLDADACGPGCGGPGCGGVTLTVSDDGRGFDPAARAAEGRADGFGMSDLRQRVDLLGGTVAVASAPGEGCTVTVCVPLPAD